MIYFSHGTDKNKLRFARLSTMIGDKSYSIKTYIERADYEVEFNKVKESELPNCKQINKLNGVHYKLHPLICNFLIFKSDAGYNLIKDKLHNLNRKRMCL